MAWGVVAGAAVSVIGGSMMGDHGAGAANAASANAANSSAAAANQQAAIAQDQWSNYNTTFQPVEKQLVNTALNYGSDANVANEGAIADATATQQIGLSNAARTRAQQRMGVNPNSGAGLALAGENANNEALMKTGAVNTARKTTQDKSFAMMQDTVNAGNKVASNATTGLYAATAGLASASNANANIAANAANQYAQRGDSLAGLGNAVAKWVNTPSTTSTTSGLSTV